MPDRKDNTRPGLDLPARPLDEAPVSELASPDTVAGLGLSEPLHTRISAHADYLLKAEAKRLHRAPSSLARDLIYRGLGMIADPPSKPPKRRK